MLYKYMKSIGKGIPLSVIALVIFAACAFGNITYTLTELGSDQWLYTYEVTNDLSVPITAFRTFFFDDSISPTVYYIAKDLTSQTPDTLLVDWQENMIDVDFFGSAVLEAFYTASTTIPDSAIDPGETLGGFSVSFILDEPDIPGIQYYEFYLFESGETTIIGSGYTTVIPAPGAIALAATGLVLLRLKRRRQ